MKQENTILAQPIMDPNANPLKVLPIAQRYQIMIVLSAMWTAIFTTSISAWYLYGTLLAAHILFITGVTVTAIVFKNASDSRPMTYRDYPLEDGTARYDDVWGG
ncbi:MAG: hypothetical protein EX271_00435 [Acidimicrobiales bacterium]|nr:hypothetical protein [Hyphomonadaceae bacterium]RZV44959.1 MAG: hypothetical protein EX271_00435 [Acidimicrobiales bacterium]